MLKLLMQKRGEGMKKFIALIMFVILQICLCINVFAADGVSWYCVRKKDNTQPTLSTELMFAEKYDLYWF